MASLPDRPSRSSGIGTRGPIDGSEGAVELIGTSRPAARLWPVSPNDHICTLVDFLIEEARLLTRRSPNRVGISQPETNINILGLP